MALNITNGGNGNDLQLASGVSVALPNFNSNYSDDFEIRFYGKLKNNDSTFVMLANSGAATNNPVVTIEPQNSNLIRIRNEYLEKTANLTTVDFTSQHGFFIRIWRQNGSLNVRMQELDVDGNLTGDFQYQFLGSFNGNLSINSAFDGNTANNANFGTARTLQLARGSVDRLYNFTKTSGTVVPDENGGTSGTLINATKEYRPIFKPSDEIVFTSALVGITEQHFRDANNNQFALTTISDTSGTIQALAANLQACLFGDVDLVVSDGTSTESTPIYLSAPTGYDLVTADTPAPIPLATNWDYDFDVPAVVGDQSLDNHPTINHNSNFTTSGVAQGSYTYFVIRAATGIVSEITKTFEAQSGVIPPTVTDVSLASNGWIAPPANGTKWSPPILRTANFSGGTDGQSALGNDAWDDLPVTQRNLYSNEQSLTNGLSSKIIWLQSGSNDGGGRILEGNRSRRYYKGSTIWFQVHTYFPTGFDYFGNPDGGGRIKFLRVHTFDSNDNNDGYNDIYIANESSDAAFAYIYEGNQTGGFINIGTDADLPAFNTWESYQMMVTLDDVPVDQGGQGRVMFWKNNQLLFDMTSRQTLADPQGYAKDCHLNTFWNGSLPPDQHYYADGITVTNQTPTFTDAGGNPLIEDLI